MCTACLSQPAPAKSRHKDTTKNDQLYLPHVTSMPPNNIRRCYLKTTDGNWTVSSQWDMVVVVSWCAPCMAEHGNGTFCIYSFWSLSGNIICSLDSASESKWTMTQSTLRMQPKRIFVFCFWECGMYATAKSVTWPESSWTHTSIVQDITEGTMPQEQARTKRATVLLSVLSHVPHTLLLS